MKILFASAEVDPFSKVGGLADVAAALPQRLREMGHDVRVVTPGHASANRWAGEAKERRKLVVPLPGRDRPAEIVTVPGVGGVPVDLICEEHYFAREHVYGEPDDLLRYQFFCRAIIQMLTQESWIPDILHLNDWHTAPLAFALRNLAWRTPVLRGIASVFTIHNLRYRGPDEFNDFLSQAIYYSDAITTVSPTYAREILKPAFGEGLDPLLGLREGSLRGILNGLNYDLFNPRTDVHLPVQFDLSCIEERAGNRTALRRELGLGPSAGPIAAMVTRLTEQKGVDLVIQAAPELIAAGAQLVVLGAGDASLVSDLRKIERAHPGDVSLTNRFDEALAQRIYGGADIFLMPSRYEPCGLGQIIAMRYGAVPIGHRTGGLADTIVDLEEHPEPATGFLFDEFSSHALAGAFDRAVRAFRDPPTWEHLQRNGMSHDYSWRASAMHYVDVYVSALRARGIVALD